MSLKQHCPGWVSIHCPHQHRKDSEMPCPVGFLFSPAVSPTNLTMESSPHAMGPWFLAIALKLFLENTTLKQQKSRIATNSLPELTSDPLPLEQSLYNFSSPWVPSAARRQHLYPLFTSFCLSYFLFSCSLQEESFLTGIQYVGLIFTHVPDR